jgi:hypothetical protein
LFVQFAKAGELETSASRESVQGSGPVTQWNNTTVQKRNSPALDQQEARNRRLLRHHPGFTDISTDLLRMVVNIAFITEILASGPTG